MFFDEDGGGQKNLRRILQAYALHNPELGYCQGMGMIVGILLMRMTTEVCIFFIHKQLVFLGSFLDA